MATYWTLATGGHEKQFPDWGALIDFSIQRTSKGKAAVTLRTKEDFDPVAVQWTFKSKGIIYRDRASADGTPDSFSAGSIVFQGYFDDPRRVTSGGRQNIEYQINNVWWLFERNQFKQYRNVFAGFDATHTRVAAVSINDPGAGGYARGDVVTIAGGTGTAATVNIAAVDGSGNPTVVSLANGGGSYTVNPASPNTPTGGSGSGLKLDLSFGQAATYDKKVSSEIYLGEQLHSADGYVSRWPNGNGDQISEVIDWMNLSYNPTRHPAFVGSVDPTQDVVTKGTIDPHTQMLPDRVNTIYCDEAIKKCLRWDPDAVIVEDPTTTIPTISVRKLGKWNYATIPPTFIDYTNLPEVTENITAQQEREILLQGQLSKVLPGVLIYYKSINLVDGQVSLDIVLDVFPASGVDDFTPETSSHTIELDGERLTYNKATIKSAAIAGAVSATASDRKQWWKDHDKSVDANHDAGIDDSTVAFPVATVVDDSNTAIDTSVYAYELLDGAPAWAGAKVIRARISAIASFSRYTNSAHTVLDTKHNNRVFNKTLRLTNVASGTYRNVDHYESAEVPPVGVAESVYRSLAASQYAGSITFVDTNLRSDITIGCRLKLVGPNTTFTNLLVQEITTEPVFGRTTVTFGPCPPVDMDAWIELARASRARTTYDMPSGRGTGSSAGNSSTIDSGLTPAADDTSHGVGGATFLGIKRTLPP